MIATLAPARLGKFGIPKAPETAIIYLFDVALRDDIINAANRYGVPPEVALAVAMQESGIRQYNAQGGVLRGGAGEYGIFQLMPPTAAGLKVDPTNPQQNIDGGVRYLAQQYNRFGNWNDALVAYNAGPGTVINPTRVGGRPFAQGSAYANQVLARLPSTLHITEQPGGVHIPAPPVLPVQQSPSLVPGGGGEIPLFTANVFGDMPSHTALLVVLGLLGAVAASEAV